jgi:Domain of unknown function (DU1801)
LSKSRCGDPDDISAAPPSLRYTTPMQSKAKTVREYLASLPEDRRAAIQAVRAVILKNLHKDYEEGMQYGGIGYYVPHRVYPPGYHCDPRQPLPFAGLGSQKHHLSLGIMSTYLAGDEGKWFRAAWAKTGKKLDMGACCVRFKKLEDLPLDLIGQAIRRTPPQKLIDLYQSNIQSRKKPKRPAKKKVAAQKRSARK